MKARSKRLMLVGGGVALLVAAVAWFLFRASTRPRPG